MPVQRLHYFTGLFLEEPDFTLEQTYHLEMRRKMNFALFNSGILFGLDVDREAPERIRIDPGMAVDRNGFESQGREIVLTESRTVDLSGFDNGDQVYITISYDARQTNPKPPSDIASRWTEDPIIQLFKDDPLNPGFPADQNLKIILAKVRKGDLSDPDLSERQLAQIRLGGGGGISPGGPTITNIEFDNPPSQGSAVTMTIRGTNLANNPDVTVLLSSGDPDSDIISSIDFGSSDNIALVVNLTIASGAGLGNRKVRVRTDDGEIVEENAFDVLPPAPVLSNITPVSARQSVTVPATINGSNLNANPRNPKILFSDNSEDTNVTITIDSAASDGTSLNVTLVIALAATVGGRKVQIQTDGGLVTSAVGFFTVNAAPVVKSILPSSATEGSEIQIRGSDIRDETLNPGDPATGTVVRFVDPTNSANFVEAATPNVGSDISPTQGPQRVLVNVPLKGGLPTTVNIELQIEGAKSTKVEGFIYL